MGTWVRFPASLRSRRTAARDSRILTRARRRPDLSLKRLSVVVERLARASDFFERRFLVLPASLRYSFTARCNEAA